MLNSLFARSASILLASETLALHNYGQSSGFDIIRRVQASRFLCSSSQSSAILSLTPFAIFVTSSWLKLNVHNRRSLE